MTDKNTPGPWSVRVRRDPWREPGTVGEIVDCFVQAPDVHGYAYNAEVLGDDEYREESGMQRKLADCQLIAAAIPMREALRAILSERIDRLDDVRDIARRALAELDRVPT